MGVDLPSPGPPRRLTVVGREVVLTPTEARLWDALREQPGQPLSRAELIARAMGGAVVLERTIDVHVKALRRKLGTALGTIETVHGVGYRYVPTP
jgi:two-component system, OmpR family, phosphate regulon response regulator PhoB